MISPFFLFSRNIEPYRISLVLNVTQFPSYHPVFWWQQMFTQKFCNLTHLQSVFSWWSLVNNISPIKSLVVRSPYNPINPYFIIFPHKIPIEIHHVVVREPGSLGFLRQLVEPTARRRANANTAMARDDRAGARWVMLGVSMQYMYVYTYSSYTRIRICRCRCISSIV